MVFLGFVIGREDAEGVLGRALKERVEFVDLPCCTAITSALRLCAALSGRNNGMLVVQEECRRP